MVAEQGWAGTVVVLEAEPSRGSSSGRNPIFDVSDRGVRHPEVGNRSHSVVPLSAAPHPAPGQATWAVLARRHPGTLPLCRLVRVVGDGLESGWGSLPSER
jgi:hypothetical protein